VKFLTPLLSLIIPISCIGCSADGKILCASCESAFTPSQTLIPRRFTLISSDVSVGSLIPYDERVSRIVLGAKDDGNRYLEAIIIEALSAARSLFPAELLLTPIPSTASVRRKRGRDFTLDLARKLAQETGDQISTSLRLERKIAPQKSLSARARAVNMHHAFSYHRTENEVGAKAALLVDDVMTTGATLREGVRALQMAGRPCVGAITAAFSPNWSECQPQR
jgi:predicted amidophosphoribosyltransferase